MAGMTTETTRGKTPVTLPEGALHASDGEGDPPGHGAEDVEPITLARMGSFHLGGRRVEIEGRPVATRQLAPGGIAATIDPNGGYMVEQMYVQYFVPRPLRGRGPLLLWHGGGMTGVTYETTPDGREGWLNFFLRRGWAVFSCDAVERGRAGWPAPPVQLWGGDPVLIPVEQAQRQFRMTHAGRLFPQDAFEQLGRQLAQGAQHADQLGHAQAVTRAEIGPAAGQRLEAVVRGAQERLGQGHEGGHLVGGQPRHPRRPGDLQPRAQALVRA